MSLPYRAGVAKCILCMVAIDYMTGLPIVLSIMTHNSESRGQEEAQQRDHQVSYLHVAPPSNSQML